MLNLFDSVLRDESVLWVTHEYDRIPERINRIILLTEGEIHFIGKRSEALKLENLRNAGLA